MSGAGFEFMPGGMIRELRSIDDLDKPGFVPPAPRSAADVKAEAEGKSLPVAAAPPSENRRRMDPARPDVAVESPRDLLKQARLRIKWLRSEMKRMAKLKKELGELERLVKAAKEKPQSNLRTIKRAG